MKMQASKAASQRKGQWAAIKMAACCLFSLLTISQSVAQNAEPVNPNRCGTADYEQFLQKVHPLRRKQIEALNQNIQRFSDLKAQGRIAQSTDETVYRIPVVVHVIHNNTSNFIGGSNNPNITEAQIQDQIAVLNEDFRRKEGTKGYNTSPIGSDTGIEFYLATTDPSGNATSGITRTYYNRSEFNVNSDWELASSIAYWPSDKYLNIWVVPKLNNDYLGFAKYPTAADTLKGLSITTDEKTDGLLISSLVFGRVCPSQYRYNCLGRTATHEIGHWLGLIHTWGDAFCGNDYVYDTPVTESSYTGTTCTDVYSNCSGTRTRNLIENYMDYSPDFCMNMFTKGQRERMRAVLQLSPRRVKLVQASSGPLPESDALTVNIANPVTNSTADAQILFKGSKAFTVELYDVTGRLVYQNGYAATTSTTISLSMANYQAGSYILRVKADQETVSKRLLVL